MITVLHEQRETRLAQSHASSEGLWLDRGQLEQATGWSWKPQGLCQGDTCVPIPPASAAAMVRGDTIDAAAMWRHMGQPVVHDKALQTWVLGTGARQRADALSSLQAPDFSLPDLNGQMHSLSDFRGKKVFLATWASW
jgi:AhpC/TSA family